MQRSNSSTEHDTITFQNYLNNFAVHCELMWSPVAMIGWALAITALYIMYAYKNGRSQLLNSQSKLAALLLIIAVVGVLLLFGSYNKIQVSFWSTAVVEVNEQHTGPRILGGVTPSSSLVNQEFYGIMFDAGSTGSRVHAFKFKHLAPGQPFEMINEYFEEVKPGLSSYAGRPEEGAASLIKLLDKAKESIPSSKWSETPIALKATAGLRLLPGEQSRALLDQVEILLKKYPFKLGKNAVSIMEGTDEGIFCWFTVNFFTGLISDVSHSLGVLDLGGGSTQITFVPQDQNTLKTAPANYTSKIHTFGKEYSLYSYSYLGLGLMSGRLQMLGGKEGDPKNPETFQSDCFPASYKGSWKHGDKQYTIKGADVKGSRAEACNAKAKQVISAYKIHQVSEVKNQAFTTISYYFDRAKEVGLVKDYEGGPVTIADYWKKAEEVCSKSEANKDNPFLCLDLCYISSLLQDGFGFKKDTTVKVGKRVKGNEISWALGAMIQQFETKSTR